MEPVRVAVFACEGASLFHQLPGADTLGNTDDSARQCLARVMAT